MLLDQKKVELEEQRKMFTDTSLKWAPRELDNSRWIGINNWNAVRDNFRWHQLTEAYTTPIDIIWADEEVVPSYKDLPYSVPRDQKEKEEENA